MTDYIDTLPPRPDAVDAPAHYAGDGEVDCRRAMRSMLVGYGHADAPLPSSAWCAMALRYIWRWPLKNGVQDLRKARRCIDYAIEEMEES